MIFKSLHRSPRTGAELGFVVALLLLAAALRIPGLTYGQPDMAYYPSYADRQMVHEQLPIQPDEYEFVSIGLEMVVQRSVKLPYVNRTLQVLINALTYWLTGSAEGITPALRDGVSSRAYAPFALYVIGRTYAVLESVFVVAGIYAIARRLGGRFAALGAGLVAAVSMTAVQHAHYATTSSAAAAFAVLCVWASFMALDRHASGGRWVRWLALAGLAAGFAGGNRYNAAAVSLVVFFSGLVLLNRGRSWPQARRILAGWLMFPVGIVISIPQLIGFTSSRQTLEHFLFAVRQYSSGLENAFLTPYGLVFELRHLALFTIGIGAALAAVLGLVMVLRAFPGWDRWLHVNSPFLYTVLLLTYLIPYALVVLRTVRPGGADQLLIPFAPFVAVFAGLGVAWLYDKLSGSRVIVGPGLALLLVVMPLALTTQTVRMFTLPETRYVMLEWVYEHVPRGQTIYLNGPYNVPLDGSDYPTIQTFGGEKLPSADDLRASGATYMILSDAYTFDLLRSWEVVPAAYRAEIDTYLADLDAAFPVVAEIRRVPWVGYDWFTNTATYWHHPGLTLYCLTDATCAAVDF